MKLMNYFWNRGVPGHNRHKNRAGLVGLNANRKAIRYDFRGAPITDPVWCEHGLKWNLVFKTP